MLGIKNTLLLFGLKACSSWGPGVHLHLGNKILTEDKINRKIKEVIKNNNDNFLYGNTAPDITLGKKYIKELDKHSHSWETGFKMLERAGNDGEAALAYGYLTHLAADIVAHNFFLPKQLLVGRGLRGFAHTVWEIKVDLGIYHDTYELIEMIANTDFSKEDEYIKGIISKAVLPFGVNRKIFEYSLKSVKNRYFYKMANLFTKHEKWHEENSEAVINYHNISYGLMIDVINNGKNSVIVKYDPNGEVNLDAIKEFRKEYKALKIENYEKNFYNIPGELLEKG